MDVLGQPRAVDKILTDKIFATIHQLLKKQTIINITFQKNLVLYNNRVRRFHRKNDTTHLSKNCEDVGMQKWTETR